KLSSEDSTSSSPKELFESYITELRFFEERHACNSHANRHIGFFLTQGLATIYTDDWLIRDTLPEEELVWKSSEQFSYVTTTTNSVHKDLSHPFSEKDLDALSPHVRCAARYQELVASTIGTVCHRQNNWCLPLSLGEINAGPPWYVDWYRRVLTDAVAERCLPSFPEPSSSRHGADESFAIP
ncbi:hypothetical protein V5O48_016264, partial [Marasmius crinis-equi]